MSSRAQTLAQRRGIRLRAGLPEDLPMVHADPLQIAQVLQNLVGKAVLPAFVMLTANESEELASKAIRLGMYDFMRKGHSDHYLKRLPAVLISAHHRRMRILGES